MAIQVTCPQCGTRGNIRAERAGRQVRCPNCGATVDVPLSDAARLEPVESAPPVPAPLPDVLAVDPTPGADALALAGLPPPAGFWLRFAAFFIDGFILNVLSMVLFIPLAMLAPAMQDNPQFIVVMMTGTNGLMMLVSWVYFAYMESSAHQATWGKRAVGIRVTDLDGAPITFMRATGRFFGKLISALPCYLGFLIAAFTEEKQALHDFVAGTRVVHRDPERAGSSHTGVIVAVAAFVLMLLVFCGGLGAAIMLPALAKARESARRAGCVNNLRQLGLVMALYAEENQGQFPPRDQRPGNLMFDANVLYPEYLSDLTVLGCPSDPRFDPESSFRLARVSEQHAGLAVGDHHADCAEAISYIYIGHVILNDTDLATYEAAWRPGLTGPITDATDESPHVIPFHRAAPDALGVGAEAIPVVWDRMSADVSGFSHVPAGANALYMDGHVEFYRYTTQKPFPFSPAAAAFMDANIPAPSGNPADAWGDCP